jgi:hypothetical protein
MGNASLSENDVRRRKRLLRLDIARSRRRIDAAVRGTQREGRRLASWRTYARRFPAGSLAAAFGVGLIVSVGLRPSKLIRRAGTRMLRRSARHAAAGLLAEVGRIWQEAAADSEGAANRPRAARTSHGR